MFQGKKPIIGMLHAPALPGSPFYQGDLEGIREFILRDAKSLVQGGVHALMLENYGDLPFYPDSVPDITVAHLAALARLIRKHYSIPLGINVLRNDGISALAIAHAAGAHFIRVNILTGARLTDQGILSGQAHEILRFRQRIGATSVKIFADISVKYSTALTDRSIRNEVEETVHRSGADGLIVSGEGTGKPIDLDRLRNVKALSEGKSVWVGSGTTLENILDIEPHADGFIVGSAFKSNLADPIDVKKVKAIVDKLEKRGKP